MVEVRIPPNHDLAVKKQKIVHDMHTQLPAVINLAFGAIEKQLRKTEGDEGLQASSVQIVAKPGVISENPASR